jgi:protein gp37
MSAATSIEWTERTWNPVRGCSMAKGSEDGGCLNCYAAQQAARNLPAMRSPTTGKPFAVFRESGPRWTGDVELIPSALAAPLGWRKPQRVFVNSMSDLFHEALPTPAIDSVFAAMVLAPQHTFQILTKRADRMRRYMEALSKDPADRLAAAALHNFGEEAEPLVANIVNGCSWWATQPPRSVPLDGSVPLWPLPNVWLGVSVENQKTADERIPLLLQTPAAVRFVSYEPALEPVSFQRWMGQEHGRRHIGLPAGLHQIIVGGESGAHARPFDLLWARSVVRQCNEAGVACFVKQMGGFALVPAVRQSHFDYREAAGFRDYNEQRWRVLFRNRKGGNMAEWPKDLRVREFPPMVHA